MGVNLEALRLWSSIEPAVDKIVEYHEDRLAMGAILRAVPSEILGSLARKRTARSAWEAIKTVRVGVQRVREAKAKELLKEFADITFNDGELVDKFQLRIVALANNIRILAEEITDADVIKKMLQVTPDHLSQIVVAIETFLDLNTIAVEEVVGRLRQVEERELKKKKKPPTPVDKQGRLLLSHEEWLARLKIRADGDDWGSGSSGGGSKLGKGRRGHGGGGVDSNRGRTSSSSGQDHLPATPCPKCGKTGHWARDYRNKPKKHQTHVAQGEEDEPTLLMAHAITEVIVSTDSSSTPPVRSSRATSTSSPP
jgi:hypothetical protein